MPENKNVSSHSNSTKIFAIVACALTILILLAIITTFILKKSSFDCIRQVNRRMQGYQLCEFTGSSRYLPNADNNEEQVELSVVNQEEQLT